MSNKNCCVSKINYTVSSLLGGEGASIIKNEESHVNRVLGVPVSAEEYMRLEQTVKYIGVTDRFKDVIRTFRVPETETPAGFRTELVYESAGVLRVDLVRDIAYDRNGKKRPTNLLFSADSANPYEVAPVSNLLANLTCNPGIIYDLFINNPKANIGNRFKNRDEVMNEIGNILGPGCDISVELNDPFGSTEEEILEEAAKFREMLSEYRVVIKVPHTGPVNAENVKELLTGDKRFGRRYSQPDTRDAFRGHNLALMLAEHGYRVNFTLMFEPYQTALALQARPYFINSFIRHRNLQSAQMKSLLDLYGVSGDETYLVRLRDMLVEKDYLAAGEGDYSILKAKKAAEDLLKYRLYNTGEGCDGLDGVRHNLRVLRNCNMPDTRLIICSMEGDWNYPDIDKLLAEPEFEDMVGKVVLTAEPQYLARFSSANQVISYQRRFMNAANGQN
jgi:hypothetical protein